MNYSAPILINNNKHYQPRLEKSIHTYSRHSSDGDLTDLFNENVCLPLRLAPELVSAA